MTLNIEKENNVILTLNTKIMGMFINDRAWNIQQAKKNYEWAEWHMKRAADASRRNDEKAAKDHLYSAKLYKAKGDEYMRDAAKSTK